MARHQVGSLSGAGFRPSRPLCYLLATLVTLLPALVAFAAPAAAHSALTTTEPANGSRVDTSPPVVTLHFSEPVSLALGAVQVLDSRSQPVQTGKPSRRSDSPLTVDVPLPALAPGGYVVSWRVLSADSHPISGAFTFQVGPPGAAAPVLNPESVETRGDTFVGVAFSLVRALEFCALMMALGALGFVLVFQLDEVTRSRARAVFFLACGVLVVSTSLAFLLQGIYAAGLGIGRIVDASVTSATLSTRFGVCAVIRVVVVILLAVIVRLTKGVTAPGRVIATLLAVVLVGTVSAAGHAATGRWTAAAYAFDVLHVTAAALWMGGLAVLSIIVLRARSDMRPVVAWFSGLAFWCLAVILFTGSFQAWRQLRNLSALTNTDYGHLLLIKMLVFAALLLVAGLSRQWVESSEKSGSTLIRRFIVLEIVLLALVLGVTAMLVNATPLQTTSALPGQPAGPVESRPFVAQLHAGSTVVDVSVEPARSGPNTVSVATSSLGAPADVPEVRASFSLPEKNILAVRVPLSRIAPGRFLASDFPLPLSGTWQLDIDVRTSEFDQSRVSTTVVVP